MQKHGCNKCFGGEKNLFLLLPLVQSTVPVLLLQFDNHLLAVTSLFQIADWVDLWFCDRRYSYWIQDARTRLAVDLLHA